MGTADTEIKPAPLYGFCVSMHLPAPSQIILHHDSVNGGFGKSEVEETAGKLVQFMRDRKEDSWRWFTLPELIEYYKEKGWNPAEILDGLTGAWMDLGDPSPLGGVYETEIFLVNFLGGRFAITEEFVRRCTGKDNRNVRK